MRPTTTRALRRAERGVTLVELMVALGLGMALVVALAGVFASAQRARLELGRSVELHESGRYALNYLQGELSQAGFYGGILIDPQLPALAIDLPCVTLDTAWAQTLAIHVRGLNQDSDQSLFNCISNLRKPNTDAVFMQRVSTCVAGAADCTDLTSGRPYLQVALCGEQFLTEPFKLAPLPGAGIESPFKLMGTNCDPTQPAPLRAYLRRIFYVSKNDELSYVEILPGAVSDPVVIAGGIDNLQIEYAIDTNGDGVPDAFSHAPASAEWPNVLGAQIWVLSRSHTESPEAQGTVFKLGDISVAPGDRFKRHLFSTYLAFITPQGSREQ